MKKTRKKPLTRSVVHAIGTLVHNRAFHPSELSQYAGVDGASIVRRLRREGLLKKVGKGNYYPTSEGWTWLEDELFGA